MEKSTSSSNRTGRHKAKKFKLKRFNNTLSIPNTTNEIENLTQHQKDIMAKALQNPLVLHKIIDSMDFAELKVGRGVNKSWSKFSTETILRRDRVVLDLLSHSMNITGLIKILRGSNSNFPCSNVTWSVDNVRGEDVKTFFEIQGPKIKNLTLFGPNRTEFREILLNYLPNIEDLKIYGLDIKWRKSDHLHFPALQEFSWSRAAKTAVKLLRDTNLRTLARLEFEKIELRVLEKFDPDQVWIVKCLVYEPIHSMPEYLPKFADINLKVVEFCLNCDLSGNNMTELTAIEKIIKSSTDIMENLHFCVRTKLTLPKLWRVKVIRMWDNNEEPVIPIYFQLARVFPSLVELDCKGLSDYKTEDWTKVFESCAPLPGVKVIKIAHGCTGLSQLKRLCPNFKRVEIFDPDLTFDGSSLANIFTLWTHLEEISIRLCFCRRPDFFMDPVITGLSPLTCKQLRLAQLDVDHPLTESSETTGPSIRDLKGLKLFRIRILHCSLIPFSRISGLFSFKRMPDLKVVISSQSKTVDEKIQKSIAAELTPYANICDGR